MFYTLKTAKRLNFAISKCASCITIILGGDFNVNERKHAQDMFPSLYVAGLNIIPPKPHTYIGRSLGSEMWKDYFATTVDGAKCTTQKPMVKVPEGTRHYPVTMEY